MAQVSVRPGCKLFTLRGSADPTSGCRGKAKGGKKDTRKEGTVEGHLGWSLWPHLSRLGWSLGGHLEGLGWSVGRGCSGAVFGVTSGCKHSSLECCKKIRNRKNCSRSTFKMEVDFDCHVEGASGAFFDFIVFYGIPEMKAGSTDDKRSKANQKITDTRGGIQKNRSAQ